MLRMKSLGLQQEKYFVLLCLLQVWIGSASACLSEGADFDFKLRLKENLSSPAGGCVQIPCAFSAPVKTLSGRIVWFRGSPDFPLSPSEMKIKYGLLIHSSLEDECSIVLYDFNGQERTEEYGLMLQWGEDETHIFPERVKVDYFTAKVTLTLDTEVLVAGKLTLLSCTFPNLCPESDPEITWKGFASESQSFIRIPWKGSKNIENHVRLFYTPVAEDHQAEIACEATYDRNQTASATATLTVHSHPQILNSSACSLHQNLLTCVCVSLGVPLPDIHWLLPLENHDLSPITESDGHINVNSTITLAEMDLNSVSAVVCVSKNELGQTNVTLPVNVIEG